MESGAPSSAKRPPTGSSKKKIKRKNSKKIEASTTASSQGGDDIVKNKRSSKVRKRHSKHSKRSSKSGSFGFPDESKPPSMTASEDLDINAPTEQDITLALCKAFAEEDFLDAALDVCESRFYGEKGPEIVSWELRECWLKIITMGCMDTDLTIVNPVTAPSDIFKNKDEPPLPPNVDLWAHGALGVMPRMKRESVMDPFLRDVVEEIPDSEELSDYKERTSTTEHELQGLVKSIPRPPSPFPTQATPTTDGEAEEDAWSMETSAASFENMPMDEEESREVVLSPTTAASLARIPDSQRPKPSLEILYPIMHPPLAIKASSEMAYFKKGGKTWKVDPDEVSEIDSKFVAFKLPNQTSSDSIRCHIERGNRRREMEKKS